MEENKNINPEMEIQAVADEGTVESKTENVKPQKVKAPKKPKKEKLIKNQAFFKKGSYSLAITAIVIAGIIVLNILVGALSERFVLEFDMTADKENSISEENIKFIKSVEDKVTVTVCADEKTYSNYMAYYSQQYGINGDTASEYVEYYDQTLKLINLYNAYNDNIEIKFVDTQSSAFTAISAKYSADKLAYGDIIVSLTKGDGSERYKKIGYKDIYSLAVNEEYAAYGMTMSTVEGNNIETALTSAISYVVSDVEKKAVIFTGHSPMDYTEAYKALLESNNYSVETVADTLITKIADDTNVIVIPGPSKDFLESEISVISKFLENGNKLGKGMLVFTDATAPYLDNFYDFLSEWGVKVSDGILFETDANNCIPDDPTVMGSYNSGADEELSEIDFCIGGYNVPLKAAFESKEYIKVSSIVETPKTVVAAPKGTDAKWTGASKYTKDSYSTVIEAIKSNYDEDNNEIESRVAVFSSVAFLNSEFNETQTVRNKDVTIAMTERAGGSSDTDIVFLSKSITNENFLQNVSQSTAKTIGIIFMGVLPIVVIAAGIFIYIKRRNAE